MRKKRIIALFLTIVSCFFCGCGDTEAKQIVRDTYMNYNQMYREVWLLPSEQEVDGTIYELEGSAYIKLKDSFGLIAQVKEKTEKVCTREFAQKEFYDTTLEREQPYFYEKDGELYLLCGEMPGLSTGEIKEIKILEKKEDFIHAKMIGEEFILGETVTDIVLVKQDGVWKIDSLTLEFP